MEGHTLICQFTHAVHSSVTPELLEFLAKQGIPRDVFKTALKPISEAHNRQETLLFAASIERCASSRLRPNIWPQLRAVSPNQDLIERSSYRAVDPNSTPCAERNPQ